ncbi:MAG: AraC family transcriptional regulator [Gemmatimonadaceae bacterium]
MPRPNRPHIPVSDGSSHFRRTETSCFIAIDAWFPAHTTLPRHTHDRAIFATMLDGGFECTIARRRFDLRATSIWVEPTGEPHDNRVGPDGARVLVLQPNPAHHDIFEPFHELLDVPTTAHHGGVAMDARRLAGEIGQVDRLASLAIDSLALGMLIGAQRSADARATARAPRWLLDALAYVHEHFLRAPTIAEIARAVDVHPSYLAHRFRSHFRVSLGAYARRLRAEWAVDQLRSPSSTIADVAAAAGYFDQSHFTRECQKYLGTSPGAYRRMRHRSDAWHRHAENGGRSGSDTEPRER